MSHLARRCAPSDEVEHLAMASHRKRSNVTGERAKSHKKHVPDHVETRSGTIGERGHKEGCPEQGTYIGNGDMARKISKRQLKIASNVMLSGSRLSCRRIFAIQRCLLPCRGSDPGLSTAPQSLKSWLSHQTNCGLSSKLATRVTVPGLETLIALISSDCSHTNWSSNALASFRSAYRTPR